MNLFLLILHSLLYCMLVYIMPNKYLFSYFTFYVNLSIYFTFKYRMLSHLIIIIDNRHIAPQFNT